MVMYGNPYSFSSQNCLNGLMFQATTQEFKVSMVRHLFGLA